MIYTILKNGGELYILNYPAGNNGAAVNISTALTLEACERVRRAAADTKKDVFAMTL